MKKINVTVNGHAFEAEKKGDIVNSLDYLGKTFNYDNYTYDFLWALGGKNYYRRGSKAKTTKPNRLIRGIKNLRTTALRFMNEASFDALKLPDNAVLLEPDADEIKINGKRYRLRSPAVSIGTLYVYVPVR